MPYETSELLARIDAATNCSFAYEVPERLALTDEEKSGDLGKLAAAFEYTAAHQRTGVGSHFTPMIQMGAWCYPPPLDQVNEEMRKLWIAGADQAQSPLASARYNDICWEGGFTADRGGRGRRAVVAYLDHAATLEPYAADEDSHVSMARFEALQRAIRISQQLNDDELVSRAAQAAERATRESLASSHNEPGVALGLVEVLIEARHDDDALRELLAAGRERYATDRFILDDILQFELARATSNEQRTDLQRELVVNALAQADETEGLVRIHHLGRGIEMARHFGQSDLVNELTAKLQAVEPDELGLVRHEVTTEIPREAVEEYLDLFTRAADWPDAFDRVIQSPPSGQIEENRRQESELARTAPLSRLFPRVLVGGDGLPRFTASSEDERAEAALVSNEMLRAGISALLIAQALTRIWEKWGPISEDDFVRYFTERGHVPDPTARALARAFGRYFAGDLEGCAFCITPRLESLVRSIVLAIPLPIYRTQRAATPGQYPGLGALIPQLQQNGLDESWSRFLQGFLASPMGTNFRNELLHGFEEMPGEREATLLLVCALYLTRGFELTGAGSAEAATVS